MAPSPRWCGSAFREQSGRGISEGVLRRGTVRVHRVEVRACGISHSALSVLAIPSSASVVPVQRAQAPRFGLATRAGQTTSTSAKGTPTSSYSRDAHHRPLTYASATETGAPSRPRCDTSLAGIEASGRSISRSQLKHASRVVSWSTSSPLADRCRVGSTLTTIRRTPVG